jgi:putative ABC transport system permease protein
LLSTLGIALSEAVLILGNFTGDSVDSLIDFQFFRVQRNDLVVTFAETSSSDALAEVRHLAGVVRCEPFRSVPVRLRYGVRSRRLAILGLQPDAMLYRPLDETSRPVSLAEEGLMISEKLAEVLKVRPGDELAVEVLEGARPVHRVRVASVVSDYEGTSAYMEIGALRRLMHEGRTVSGAFLQIDGSKSDRLFTRLKNTPRVASVAIKKAAIESFRRTIADSLLRLQAFNVTFAAIIAFGVVYNCARISLTERSRELATLRVIGFTRAEVSLILLGELSMMTLVALPVGLALGTGFAALTTRFYDTELFRIPLVIAPSTYALAATVTLLSTITSGLMVRRHIDRLDLVSVLKTKE